MNIFITGASRGIGKAIVYKYAKSGHNLFLYARNENNLEQIKTELEGNAGQIEYLAGDVADYESYERAINLCREKFGSIDLAILNAGISSPGFLPSIDYDEFEYVMKVNMLSYVFAISKLAKIMIKQGTGSIAAVSSLADVRGFPGSGSYSASKAALSNFLESARAELKNSGIKVITIRPGFVTTDMTSKNKFYMPFIMKVDKAADIIIKKLAAGKTDISFPRRTKYLSSFLRLVPNKIFDYLSSKIGKPKLYLIDKK